MSRTAKLLIGAAFFALFILVAAMLYNVLSESVDPGVSIADQMASQASSARKATPAPAQTYMPTPTLTPAQEGTGTASGSDAADDEPASDPETITAPDFTVQDTDGNTVKLSDMLGKPIVLNFWASWCPPCKSEMPDFERVYAEMGDEITFMMINLTDGSRETLKSAQQYIADNGFTFPVYFDTQQDAAYEYGISSIPTTVFIDKHGNVAVGSEGMLDEELVRLGIDIARDQGDER